MAYIGNPAAPTLAQVSDNTITSAKIVDGAVTPSDLSTGHPNWDSSGNVGIGTSGPGAKLNIDGAASDAVVLFTNNGTSSAGGNGLRLGIDNSLNAYLNNTKAGPLVFYTSNAERMRILSSGGITFNGDTAAANALDDYEEGTWTPTIAFGGGTTGITYTQNEGTYVKIGKLVFISAAIFLSNKGSSSGTLWLDNLPFIVDSPDANYSGFSFGYFAGITFADFIMVRPVAGSNYAIFSETTNAGTSTAITNSDCTNTSGFRLSGCYIASA